MRCGADEQQTRCPPPLLVEHPANSSIRGVAGCPRYPTTLVRGIGWDSGSRDKNVADHPYPEKAQEKAALTAAPAAIR